MERQERGQEEKKQRNGVMSYDALDNDETVGLEAVGDYVTPSMDDMLIAQDIHERLYKAIEAMPRADRELIKAIYFDGKTEQEYAEKIGMSQTGVSYRRRRILAKMKEYLNFLGYFICLLL